MDVDILCFTESHLDDTVSDEFLHLSDAFDVIYRKDRKNHGVRILVYFSSSLVHQIMSEHEIYCPESIWACVTIYHEKYLIGTFYSPRNSDSDCFTAFNRNIEKAMEIASNVIILGDLNKDLLNTTFYTLEGVSSVANFITAYEESQYNQDSHFLICSVFSVSKGNLFEVYLRKPKDILHLISLYNIIKEQTRQMPYFLDTIIISTDMRFLDSGALQNSSEISDHSATYIVVSFPYDLKPFYERTVFLYKKPTLKRLVAKLYR